jgi:hypothetical protein
MTKQASGTAGSGKSDSGVDALPPIDFSTFVLSISTSALYQMGKVPGPDGAAVVEPDLLVAQQTIDALKMLRAKTEGNLDHEESKLLDSLLYELHMNFVELQNKEK